MLFPYRKWGVFQDCVLFTVASHKPYTSPLIKTQVTLILSMLSYNSHERNHTKVPRLKIVVL